MDSERIRSILREVCGESGKSLHQSSDGECYATVPADCLVQVMEKLLHENLLHHLSAITALDDGRSFSAYYHLWLAGGLTLRVSCPRENPVLPSVSKILPAALWYEREAHDLFGILFEGHPALEPLLVADEWDGPPPLLHKDD